jgi:hypothetical protein
MVSFDVLKGVGDVRAHKIMDRWAPMHGDHCNQQSMHRRLVNWRSYRQNHSEELPALGSRDADALSC